MEQKSYSRKLKCISKDSSVPNLWSLFAISFTGNKRKLCEMLHVKGND